MTPTPEERVARNCVESYLIDARQFVEWMSRQPLGNAAAALEAVVAHRVRAAVAAEREACAGEAEAHEDIHELNGDDEFVCGRNLCAMIIAAAIRARGESDD